MYVCVYVCVCAAKNPAGTQKSPKATGQGPALAGRRGANGAVLTQRASFTGGGSSLLGRDDGDSVRNLAYNPSACVGGVGGGGGRVLCVTTCAHACVHGLGVKGRFTATAWVAVARARGSMHILTRARTLTPCITLSVRPPAPPRPPPTLQAP